MMSKMKFILILCEMLFLSLFSQGFVIHCPISLQQRDNILSYHQQNYNFIHNKRSSLYATNGMTTKDTTMITTSTEEEYDTLNFTQIIQDITSNIPQIFLLSTLFFISITFLLQISQLLIGFIAPIALITVLTFTSQVFNDKKVMDIPPSQMNKILPLKSASATANLEISYDEMLRYIGGGDSLTKDLSEVDTLTMNLLKNRLNDIFKCISLFEEDLDFVAQDLQHISWRLDTMHDQIHSHYQDLVDMQRTLQFMVKT